MMDFSTLSPQEQFLYLHHMKNLVNGGEIFNKDGTKSTMLQAVVGPIGKKFYNIPTVWDGKALPVEQALDRAKKVGLHKWPSYDTPEAADDRYIGQMHDNMEQDMGQFTPAPLTDPTVGGVLSAPGMLSRYGIQK
jgi:hypothetical protein